MDIGKVSYLYVGLLRSPLPEAYAPPQVKSSKIM
jgi:hypothetical protein